MIQGPALWGNETQTDVLAWFFKLAGNELNKVDDFAHVYGGDDAIVTDFNSRLKAELYRPSGFLVSSFDLDHGIVHRWLGAVQG